MSRIVTTDILVVPYVQNLLYEKIELYIAPKKAGII